MIVHPEVGKWLIALGEKAFGMDPFGWRIAAAVVGALMVLVMCRFARRLTGSTALGCVAGLLLSFDGLHFVLSRLALLDIFVAFFLLCGVHCLVADRDWYRARMARLVPAPIDRRRARGDRCAACCSGRGCWPPASAADWRCGTKWEALYPLAAFGLLVWLWSRRRPALVRRPLVAARSRRSSTASRRSCSSCWSRSSSTSRRWTGWLVHAHDVRGAPLRDAVHPLRRRQGLADPHRAGRRAASARSPSRCARSGTTTTTSTTFHTHFLNDSTHTYASKPSGWLLLNRPVGVAADTDIKPGTQGCDAPPGSDCLRQVLLLGTPGDLVGRAASRCSSPLVMWVGARDWRYGVAVVGTASTWLPWLQYDDRPIFSFYAIITLPFLVLALTLAMGRLIGPSTAPSPTAYGRASSWPAPFFVLVLLNFAWFWPIWTNQLLTHGEWLDRIWFSRWI